MARLHRLLRPRSIAVFGGNWATSVVEQLLRIGFTGDIWPVHPGRAEICGIECLDEAGELPTPPDASFIAVNRDRSVGLLRELSEMGAGGAVCFASGFAESMHEDVRGVRLQADLVDAAGQMPFLGPNCYGFINYLEGALLWPDQHGGVPCTSGVGIVTQSSNIAINLTMQRRSLPIAAVVTVGNQASVSQGEVACFLIEDPGITAIGLHVEGFGQLDRLVELARRSRQLGKPVIAIKAGRSSKSRAATVSHTGSIAGSNLGATTLLRRLGIGEAESLPEFVETLKLLHCGGPLSGRRIGSLSCSGGEACLVADSCTGRNLVLDDLEADQEEALRRELGDMVHLDNPLDYHTYHWGDEEALHDVFRAMLLGRYDLAFLVMDFPRPDRCSAHAWEPAVAAIERAAAGSGSRVAIVSSMPEGLTETWSQRLLEAGITPLQGIDDAIRSAEIAADIGDAWRRPFCPPAPAVQLQPGDVITLDEAGAKRLLAREGVGVPAGAVVHDGAGAAVAAEEIGYPVVLKRTGVTHKTGANAVALGLTTPAELLSALDGMEAGGSFLVERQVEHVLAELIIGVVRDPECGLLLVMGSGGVFAELTGDARHCLLPVTTEEIRDALAQLRIWPVLQGYRGSPPADVGALVDAVAAVARLAERHAGEVTEIEINPFLALRKGGIAADALVRRISEGD